MALLVGKAPWGQSNTKDINNIHCFGLSIIVEFAIAQYSGTLCVSQDKMNTNSH